MFVVPSWKKLKMNNQDAVYTKIAFDFASALANNDFKKAHSLLCQDRQEEWTELWLKNNYKAMIEYGEGAANVVEVMEIMTDWPARKASQVMWVYVAIAGDDFSEAVTVIISENNGISRIQEIEWARP